MNIWNWYKQELSDFWFNQTLAIEEEVVDLKGEEIEEEGVLTQGHPQGKK